MSIKGDRGTPFQQTSTGTTSAVATQNGSSNTTSYITDISGSSDKSGAKILVKQGATVIWQDVIGTVPYGRTFITPLIGAVGADISVTVDGTLVSNANVAGFIINNS